MRIWTITDRLTEVETLALANYMQVKHIEQFFQVNFSCYFPDINNQLLK